MEPVKHALIIKECQMIERDVNHRSALRLSNFKLMEDVPVQTLILLCAIVDRCRRLVAIVRIVKTTPNLKLMVLFAKLTSVNQTKFSS
jgi:hypothetical protein